MTKLFISFIGTIEALESGRVNAADLESGLFAFACPRSTAITLGAENVYTLVNSRPDLHALLAAAVLKAEDKGRVRWKHERASNMSFDLINELLTANGHKRLMPDDEYDYSFPAVERRSTELEVIWGR